MKLLPVDKPELLHTVAGWMADEKNYRWLDFGAGHQVLSPAALAIMVQKPTHCMRVFTADEDDKPIGVVGLTNIKRDFKTATLWIVLGEKRFSLKGYAVRACSELMTHGFKELGLQSVDAWAVSCNYSSLRLINNLNFKPIGIQRRTHIINGNVYDRMWFDLLDSEHQEGAQRD